jgi:hypothetical protein
MPSKTRYCKKGRIKIKVTGIRGRRRKQLLDDLKDKRGYWKLKVEALGRTVWRTDFGRGYGGVVRQIAKCNYFNPLKTKPICFI